MISAESYKPEWIEHIIQTHKANSYDLAEKMIYAFTLVEQLKAKGLDFIFKGGTALVLMLNEFHRFSKDIDIIIPEKPGNLKEIFDRIINDAPFLRWEIHERKNDEFNVPKEHYKFIYRQSKPSKFPEQPILLDIIYVPCTYPKTEARPVQSFVLKTTAPYEELITPTLNSLTGDKLTAFAPGTIGIQPGRRKEVEIAKQLFDLNKLFNHVSDIGEVSGSFRETAFMVARHHDLYQMDFAPAIVCDDTIETAFVMALNGKENRTLFEEIRTGVFSLNIYLSKGNSFGWNVALLAAAKVAYLTGCIKIGKELTPVLVKSYSPKELKEMKITHEKYFVLNKALKAGYPEAWLYWYHTAKLLSA